MDKNQAVRLLDETFNNDFDVNRFVKFIKELFNNFEINSKSWTVWESFREYIESFQLIGSYEDSSKKIIDVLAVKLRRTGSVDRARTMQRNFIAKWLSNAEKEAALVAFYGDDPQDWRFSFVKMEYQLVKEIDGKVKIAKELTPAKRYSFLVGVNEPNHTCKSQFVNLLEQEEFNPSIEQIEASFSIDKVTKEFFIEYKELYLKLKEAVEKFIRKDKNIREEFEDKAISTVDFTKKLMGQIVFIYFLQKKGWLGVEKDKGKFKEWGTGPKNFLRKLFEKKNYENFFNDVLEPLFYEALATERDDDYYRLFECKIPFLNGGLFEPMNEYNWRETDLLLDNSIFSEILDTFDQYNFTVREDEPLEKEVAIDPEMLGKVFENLIEENIRKGQGAYYTPREIVHYMCQQSLINYLQTNSGIAKEDIETFIQLGDFAIDILIKERENLKKYGKSYVKDEEHKLPKSIRENYAKIDELLKNIKIVDPAVGSGAFPVGMMNEIVKARSILSIFFNEEEQKKRTNYNLKREIIENCLYGVDIDSSAVDIAKLRFWLSLIVDEMDMKNIQPLPNLDHKIMCGNSLLEEFEGHKLFDDKLLGEVKKDYSFEIKQIDTEIAKLNQEKGEAARGKNGKSIKDIDKEINSLIKKKQKILSAPKSDERNATFEEIVDKKIKESQKKLKELKELQHKFFNEQNRKLKKQYRDEIERIEWELIEATLEEQEDGDALEKLKEYKKNKSKPFFLWKLYFSEVFTRENPGFDVVIANPPYVVLSPNYFRDYFLTKGNNNTYVAFLEIAKKYVRTSGIIAYIIPTTWMAGNNFLELRRYLIEKKSIQQLIQLPYDIFQAYIDNVILMITGEGIQNNIVKTFKFDIRDEMKGNFKINNINIQDWKDNQGFVIFLNIDLIKILERYRNIPSWQLGEIAKVQRGTLPPSNNELISDEKIKKLKGRFIKWFNHQVYRYLIKKSKETVYVEYNHLKENKPLELFKCKKLLGRQLISRQFRLQFAYFDEEYAFKKNLYAIYDLDVAVNYFYLLAVLNSKFYSYVQVNLNTSGQRDDYPSFSLQDYKNFLIPKLRSSEQQIFSEKTQMINKITEDENYLLDLGKQSKVKKLEKEIDQLVYKLYELTPEEIKIVEEFGK